MKTFHFLLSFLFLASVAFGANVGDDTLTIGKPGSSGDKEIKFRGSVRSIRDNQTTGKLEFTQDGATFKEIGSGSGNGGGGDNFLGALNAGFEDGTDNWIATGSQVFAVTQVDQIGDSTSIQSATFDTGGAAILRSALVTVPLGAENLTCSADFRYQWVGGTPANATVTLVDGADSLLLNFPALEATTGTEVKRMVSPVFDCNLASQLQIKIEFTADEPLMKLDQFFLGSEKNSIQIAQASLHAKATWLSATNCVWDDGTTVETFWTIFDVADADCNDPIVVGAAKVPSIKAPYLEVDNLPPGNYRVQMKGYFQNTNPGTQVIYSTAFFDGTSYTVGGLRQQLLSTDTNRHPNSLSDDFTVTSTVTNARFYVLQQGASGVSAPFIRNNEATQSEDNFEIVLYRYPLETSEALTLETSGFIIRASIAGANPNLGTANEVPFGVIQDPGLVINTTAYGPTAEVKIACADGTAAIGADCGAADEQVGINFDIPSAGDYNVCFTFSHSLNGSGGSGNYFSDFRLIETTSSSITALRSFHVEGTNGGTSSDIHGTVVPICSLINFPTSGNKTIRLTERTTLVSGAIGNNRINGGSRDIYVTVTKETEQKPTPIFTDLQNTLNSKIETQDGTPIKKLSINGVCGPSSSITNSIGVSSLGNVSAGDCTITTSEAYSNIYHCDVTPRTGGPVGIYGFLTPTSTTIDVSCKFAASGADCGSYGFSAECIYD